MKRAVWIAAPALAALALLGGCMPRANPGTGGAGTCPSTIEIQGFAYSPASCTVTAGTTLTFVNRDSTAHTATTTAGAAASFDTGSLAPGQSTTITLNAAGDYPYTCTFHPSMTGSITVVAADGG